MLKVSAFYLEKQINFIPKKKLSRCQYQNKKALFTDPIFSEGFDQYVFFSITGASGTCSQDPLGANFNTRYCGQRLAPVVSGSTNIPICGKFLLL